MLKGIFCHFFSSLLRALTLLFTHTHNLIHTHTLLHTHSYSHTPLHKHTHSQKTTTTTEKNRPLEKQTMHRNCHDQQQPKTNSKDAKRNFDSFLCPGVSGAVSTASSSGMDLLHAAVTATGSSEAHQRQQLMTTNRLPKSFPSHSDLDDEEEEYYN